MGLLLFTFGGIVPIQFSIWSDSNTYEIGPWDSSRESVDIPLNLIYGESAVVDVIFEESAVADDCWVWGIVNYEYPTKFVSAASIRIEGQREVHFTFGWEDVRLIPIFVIGFLVRIFYLGGMSVEVTATITRVANIISFTGLGLLIVCSVSELAPILISRLSTKKALDDGQVVSFASDSID